MPGPGTYNVNSDHSAPKYTMNGRKSESSKDQNPGPGTYTPSMSFTAIQYSIGKSNHSTIQIKNVPGPGTYNLTNQKYTSYSIGNSKRPPLNLILDTPGPGSYNYKSSNKSPSYSIPKKVHIQKIDSDPVRLM